MIVLGIDPGSLRTGYGAIETDGRRHRLLERGILVPAPRLSLPDRLRFIHAETAALLGRLRPDALAVEDVFHAANARSALVLGHVRGVILLAGAQAGVPLHAFPPATVKVQITGFGGAAKAQVAFMVARLLRLAGDGEPGDAADALAVALCGAGALGAPAPGRLPAPLSRAARAGARRLR